MKTSVLVVTGVAEGIDKNKNEYRTINVSTPSVVSLDTEVGLKAVYVKTKNSAFNAWKVSNLTSMKGQSDFGYNLSVGDSIAGTIVKREVKTTLRDANKNITAFADSYEITDPVSKVVRTANTYSAIVLGDSSDPKSFEQAIYDAFWNAGHPLSDDARVTPRIAALVEPKVELVADEELATLKA